MRRIIVISCLMALTIGLPATAADGGNVFVRFMRWTGYGIGDGYHKCPCPKRNKCAPTAHQPVLYPSSTECALCERRAPSPTLARRAIETPRKSLSVANTSGVSKRAIPASQNNPRKRRELGSLNVPFEAGSDWNSFSRKAR